MVLLEPFVYHSISFSENPLFLAKNVAEWIEHRDVSTMLRSVCSDEKIKITLQTMSGGLQANTEYWFLTEDGLYEVLMQSRKPIAKQFKTKVKEILKDVRKHGMYATEELLNNPDLIIAIAQELKKEKELRIEAQEKIIEIEEVNNELTIKNNELIIDNEVLTAETLEWDGINLINALVRRYAEGVYNGDMKFANAWIEFKKELLYNCGININSRITAYINKTGKKPKTLEMLKTDEEVLDAAKIIVSLCEKNNIKTSDMITKFKKVA
jgi:prophage antirepressor-like protein